MKTCRCCHSPGRNVQGCSCLGGKTHSCTKDQVQKQAVVMIVIQPKSSSIDIFSIAAINTDCSNRKTAVNSRSKLAAEMSTYVTKDLQFPAILCVTEWSTKKTAHSFRDELNAIINEPKRYEQFAEKLNYDYISVLWDTNLWTTTSFRSGTKNIDQYIISAEGHYMAIRLQAIEARTMDIFLFAVHFPKKSKPETAVNLLLKAITELTRENEVLLVAIVGDFNIQFKTNKHTLFPGYTALFHSKPTTEKGSCIDNILVNDELASCLRDYVPDIHNTCPLFTHYPIRIHQ